MKNPNDYALVVGINHYRLFRPLNGAVYDATEMAKWLADDVSGGGVPDHHLKLITSSNTVPDRPIQDQIDEELQAIYDTVQQEGPARRLYFYFSGHGCTTRPFDVALCLSHWSKVFRNRALSSWQYREAITDQGLFPKS